LLCSACNKGLGLLGDDAESLRRALEYLERPRSGASSSRACPYLTRRVRAQATMTNEEKWLARREAKVLRQRERYRATRQRLRETYPYLVEKKVACTARRPTTRCSSCGAAMTTIPREELEALYELAHPSALKLQRAVQLR
jgi:hypothetical protein